jgi:hypothetical protein
MMSHTRLSKQDQKLNPRNIFKILDADQNLVAFLYKLWNGYFNAIDSDIKQCLLERRAFICFAGQLGDLPDLD